MAENTLNRIKTFKRFRSRRLNDLERLKGLIKVEFEHITIELGTNCSIREITSSRLKINDIDYATVKRNLLCPFGVQYSIPIVFCVAIEYRGEVYLTSNLSNYSGFIGIHGESSLTVEDEDFIQSFNQKLHEPKRSKRISKAMKEIRNIYNGYEKYMRLIYRSAISELKILETYGFIEGSEWYDDSDLSMPIIRVLNNNGDSVSFYIDRSGIKTYKTMNNFRFFCLYHDSSETRESIERRGLIKKRNENIDNILGL